MSESKSQVKPFEISKRLVWEAYLRVKANKGAAGVDGVSIEQYEQDLKNNLFKLWNRLSSGSYFPPPVKAVPIPKAGGKGVRTLGVPTVDDRIAQTVAAMYLEPRWNVCSIRTPMATARDVPHWMRWVDAGNVVGRPTG